MVPILRIMSREILAEKISAESKPNLPETMERASRLLSIGKQVSWFSNGIVQVTAKMTDFESTSESAFGLCTLKYKRCEKNKNKDKFNLILDNWRDQI